MERKGKDGKKTLELNSENINRSRLRIDTRKWLAGKLKPKTYGDRQILDVKHEVSDPEEIVAQAQQAAKRLGITLPMHLLGEWDGK